MKEVNIDLLDWEKMNGLLPVIAQEVNTREILTLAYANRDALKLTIKSGWAHYYRRSQGKILKKGETSGNYQKVHKILCDCDNDALIYLVEQTGPACHLGERTCFHKKIKNFL
jgi:phosphoribosyl-AMP cyclohydrolase